ncbi:hypothetical protein VTO73DRAFT_10736 [Trametes versicolor]
MATPSAHHSSLPIALPFAFHARLPASASEVQPSTVDFRPSIVSTQPTSTMSTSPVARPNTPVAEENTTVVSPSLAGLGNVFQVLAKVVHAIEHLLDAHDSDSCVDCMTQSLEAHNIGDATGYPTTTVGEVVCGEGECPWSYLSSITRSMQARMPIIVPDFSAGCILPYNIEIEVEVLTTTMVENVGARDPAPPTPPASPPASRSLEIAEASDPIALTASSSDAADLSSSPSMSTVSTTPASIAMYPLLVPGAPTPILPAPPATHYGRGLVARRAIACSSRLD